MKMSSRLKPELSPILNAILPKNPEVCDDLLKRALEKKYGADYVFPELEDSAERSASAVICGRYLKKS